MESIELNWMCKHTEPNWLCKYISRSEAAKFLFQEIIALNWVKHSFSLWVSLNAFIQKQPFTGVLRNRFSENMQQIYRRTFMSKCDFSKIAKPLWRAAFIYLQEYTSKTHLSRKKLKRKWISYLVPSFPIIPYSKIVNTFFIAFFSFPLCQLILLFFIIAPPQ